VEGGGREWEVGGWEVFALDCFRIGDNSAISPLKTLQWTDAGVVSLWLPVINVQ
jgi:hypothetical protein